MIERMHDTGLTGWREVVQKHHSAMVDDLKQAVDSELESAITLAVETERSKYQGAIDRAREETRRSTTEDLNQNLRRLRQSAAQAHIFRLLAEAAVPFVNRAVVLLIENNQSRVVACAHVDESSFIGKPLSIATGEAPALDSVIDTHDPVVALASASEVSDTLVRLFDADSGTRLHLFPVNVRQNTAAVLVAEGVPLSAPLELLCESVGMKLESMAPPMAALPNPALVQINTKASEEGIPASATVERRDWSDLSQEEQRLHLQAQRSARVRVAEMRLDHADELREATYQGNIYKALKTEIDVARTAFLQEFLSRTPTMVDYLHLEILRSLARDDDRLLGPDYPGPMV